MDQIQLTTREAIVWVMAINSVIGFTLGLIPLLFGYFNRQLKTGVIAIVIATIGGAALGIFVSIPTTIIFTYVIFRNSRKTDTHRPSDSDEL